MYTNCISSEIDHGVDANRHSTGVFRYRVRTDRLPPPGGFQVRGKQHQPGDIILLYGWMAYQEWPYDLELVDPEPVKQTEDPSTWVAQTATRVRVTLNESLAVHKEGCKVRAAYAGDQGIARVEITYDCGPWSVQSYLTLEDAARIQREIGDAIAQMGSRDKCDLYIRQAGGNM
jgi:hypothetical protein